MDGQKIFVIIASIIDLALFGFALLVVTQGVRTVGLLLTFFPLLVGVITFMIVKLAKKFELLRAIKYSTVAYFASYVLPVGLFLIFQPPRQMAMPVYGAQMQPYNQACWQKCNEIVNKTSQLFLDCLRKC